MNDTLLTAIIAVGTSTVSSLVSWFLARKKYNSEVEGNRVENMDKSLDFYDHLSDSTMKRLDEALKRCEKMEELYIESEKRNTQLEIKVNELESRLSHMQANICIDLICQLRKRDYSMYNAEK
jgi:hypothetical protein